MGRGENSPGEDALAHRELDVHAPSESEIEQASRWLDEDPDCDRYFGGAGQIQGASSSGRSVLVASESGGPVGIVVAEAAITGGVVVALAVHPRHRGQGVADRLIDALAAAEEYEETYFEGEVHVENTHCLGMLERLGFYRVSELADGDYLTYRLGDPLDDDEPFAV